MLGAAPAHFLTRRIEQGGESRVVSGSRSAWSRVLSAPTRNIAAALPTHGWRLHDRRSRRTVLERELASTVVRVGPRDQLPDGQRGTNRSI